MVAHLRKPDEYVLMLPQIKVVAGLAKAARAIVPMDPRPMIH